MNLLKKLLPKKEAILNMENIPLDAPKSVSKALYPKEVLEIHHAFETASDRLIEDAKHIIAEAESKDVAKVFRLESLGFKQAAQVVDTKPLMQKARLSNEIVKTIQEYKVKYPNNKFITEDQVKEICYKYNLVCGDVGRFKGFVPEKNLKEIEAFKLKKEDCCITGICWGDNIIRTKFSISLEEFEKAKHILKGTDKNIHIETSINSDQRWFLSKELSNVIGRSVPGQYFDRVNHEGMKICAPVKDMDISGLELKDGYKLEKKFVPDPVVLQPVKHGYLILTAWGDEANDPIVVNETMN